MIDFHYCFNGCQGQETGWRTCGSVSRRAGDCVRSPFFESSRVCPTLLSQRERLPRMRTAHGKCTYGVREPMQEAYISCVLGFLCMMYIDSNHRDSDMSKRLSCVSHHIDNIMELMEDLS
jgi:hypothetical protein